MSGLNESSSEESPCYESKFDSPEFKAVAIVRASVGLFSFLSCVCVLLISACLKKYQFFTQRLVLYLTVAAALHSSAYTVGRVNFYTNRTIKDPYCYFAGSFELYTAWIELLSICCITFNLFAITVLSSYRMPEREYMECIYLTVTFLLPLLWCWIPFLEEAYGMAGPWCGIRSLEEDCSEFKFGHVLQYALWYVPVYTIFLVIFVTSVVIFIKVGRDIHRCEGTPSTPTAKLNKQKIREEVKPLLWYPLIYIVLRTTLLVSQIYESIEPRNPFFALWVLRVVTSPFAGAAIAFMYAFDSETRAHLKCYCSHLKAACLALCSGAPGESHKQNVVDYEFEMHSMYGDSIEGTIARRCDYRLRVQSSQL